MKISRENVEHAMLQSRILTCAALAERAGISRQNLSTIKNRGSCSMATLIKLADALGVEPAALLPESEVKSDA